MDPFHVKFKSSTPAFTITIGRAPTRRSLLSSLTAGLMAVAGLGAAETHAKRKKRKKKHHGGGGSGCTLGCTTSVCGQVPTGCPIFPADNIWNAPIDTLPPDRRSDAYIASIGSDTGLHPDFAAGLYQGQPIGIPFVRVSSAQPLVPVTVTAYGDESDPGPYPIPADAPIEGGSCADGDRHVLVVQEETCLLVELFNARARADGSWQADSAARYDLRSNALRPAGWTSANRTQKAYVWPARHQAGASTDPDLPPLGQRFRLKADVDLTDFSPTNQIILQALKTYGMLLADNGGDWFLSGVPDSRWDDDDLHELQSRIHGRDFEAVDCSSLIADPDSGQVA
jgi:hypothetical protein